MKKVLAAFGLVISALFLLQGLRAGFGSALHLLSQSQDQHDSLIRLAVALLFGVFGFSGCKSCWAILTGTQKNVNVTIEKP